MTRSRDEAVIERLGAIMKGRKHNHAAMVASSALIIAAVLAACALGAGSVNDSSIQEFPTEQTVLDNGKALNRYT